MKLRSALLLLALASVVAFSCSKKDHNGPTQKILGHWNGTQMELKLQKGPLTYDTIIKISPPDYFKLNFKSQNQVDIDESFDGQQQQGTGYYMVQGNQLTLGDSANASDRTTFNYQLMDNLLTLTTDADTTIDGQKINGTSTLSFERE